VEPTYKQDLSSKTNIIDVTTENPEETTALGALLGSLLTADDILCLDGDLGAGKTAFTAGVAKGLGIQGVIASPTFTILIEHAKQDPLTGRRLPLYHFDAYRLSSEFDFYDLGFEEYFSFGGVCVIEWAGMIRPAIPPGALWITLRQGFQELSDQRLVTFAFPEKDPRASLFYQKTADGEWRRP
jgi:tRNA threonylcarbamoyladenosine biosynthesis protein TsaE